ncbi:ribosome hibernation-promoting factor, HPF/YfiA family [Halonatronum saccharophilum]|uniref:ribosome hibernation-promoting factor, HPF/YfiA family n=1 Tax=Halonatronum saccharophilum TaxID=150060 RepID=UPI0004822391|nr:ribosome-associated translation inhibitor RaiA [Halonatronum saccharophilum]
MKFMVRGKNLEVTEALRGYAEEKVGKIEKYFEEDTVIEAQISLEVERGRHIVEVTLFVDGLILRGEERSNDMYASIDGVIEKLESQVRKYKTRIHSKLRREKDKFGKGLKAKLNKEETEDSPKIVKTKQFAIKPMPVEEAVMQMDLLQHDFYVFSNAKTEEVNVVYKRNDGNYGLIEPTF